MRLKTKTSVFNMIFSLSTHARSKPGLLTLPCDQILDANPSLYFHLQQQRLIEYIRAGRTTEALQFAQSELAPRGFENPEFLAELERTMALLAFDQVPDPPADIAELLLPAQRARTASELNAAILASMGQGVEPKLIGLMRLLAWGENLLEEKANFPRVDLSTGTVSHGV